MKPMPHAAGLGLLAIGVFFTITRGASLVPLLFVIAGCATLASVLIPKRSGDPAATLVPAIVLFSACGAMGLDVALDSGGPWIVIPALAAIVCFAFAAFAGWGWLRIQRRTSR